MNTNEVNPLSTGTIPENPSVSTSTVPLQSNPPLPSTSAVNSLSNPTNNLPYAGFWVRFFAMLFDSLIISLIMMSISFTSSTLNSSWNLTNQGFVNILSFVLVIFYEVIFWTRDGATPGKKIFGVRVVKINDTKQDLTHGLTLSTAMIRYLGYILSGVVLGLGFFWVAFSKTKQGWHDKIAGTVVVRLDNKSRVGLRLLTLFLYIVLFIVMFAYGFVKGMNQSGKAGNIVMQNLLSGNNEDISFNFKKQREAYFIKMPEETRNLVEQSRKLTQEGKDLIAGTACNIQILNKDIEGKLKQAVEVGQKAAELSPENAYTHYNLGYAYNWSLCFDFGGDEKAVLEYQKAVELDKDFLEARASLSGIYKNLENYEAAIPLLEYVTQKAPLCGSCWLDLGEVYLRYGATTKAKEALTTAKDILKDDDPDQIKVEKLLDEINSTKPQ